MMVEEPRINRNRKQKVDLSKRSKGQRDYTEKDKIEVLKMVEMCGSVSQVARETGISRSSITKWADNSGLAAKVRIDIPAIERKVVAAIEKKDGNFVEKAYTIKEKALMRMAVLIESSHSLKDVTQAFAVLSAIGVGKDGGILNPNSGQNIVTNIQNTVVQKIINLQKLQKNGSTGSIQIDGYSEESKE